MIALRRRLRPQTACDDELVALICSHSPEALEELYSRYGPRAYRVAAAVCGDCALAEEVTVSAFAAIWQGDASDREPPGSVATGLLGRVRRRALELSGQSTGSAEPREHPEQHRCADRSEPRRPDLELLASLPDPEHEVIVLALYGALSPAEIADCLALSTDAVKERMRTGLCGLRDRLVAAAPPEPPAPAG